MIIQPLSLSPLNPGPGVAAGLVVRPARIDATGRATADGKVAEAVAAKDSPWTGRGDSVEISRQAEAQLLGQLSAEAQRQVTQLKARDREVRAHEQAHLSAAGPYAGGGPHYQYTQGPDGRRYAVGGEVSIDASPVSGDPEATIDKARVVRAAALAPAKPSAQDQRVAAAASKMEIEARQQLQRQEQAEREEETETETGRPGEFLGTRFDAVA